MSMIIVYPINGFEWNRWLVKITISFIALYKEWFWYLLTICSSSDNTGKVLSVFMLNLLRLMHLTEYVILFYITLKQNWYKDLSNCILFPIDF